MEKPDKPESILKLVQIFRAGRWEEGEKLWKEIIEQDNLPVRLLREPAQELWRRSQQKLAKELIAETVKIASSKKPLQRMEAIRLFAEYNPEHTEYSERYAQAFLEAYGERPNIRDMTALIKPQQYNLPKFIETLHRLLLFQEGTIIKHKSGWGVGKVRSIDPEKLEMIVDLKKRPNHRMDILGAAECLTPLPSENFEAMLEFQLDVLKNEAKNDEMKLLHRIFNFHKDEISAREFKEYLCAKVIPEEEWTKWWAKARKMLLVDPYVEANSGAHSKYRLRQEPLGWEQEIRSKFESSGPSEQPQIVLDYLKHTEMKQNLKYFAGVLIKLCNHYLQSNQPQFAPWLALECYLVVKECGITKLNLEEAKGLGIQFTDAKNKNQDLVLPEIDQIVTRKNVIKIYNNLRMNALAPATLEILFQYEPDWIKYINEIFKKGTDLARDTLYKHLHKNKTWSNYVAQIIKEIKSDPLDAPDGLIWLSRQVFNEKIPTIEGHAGAGLIGFFDTLMTLMRTGGTLKSLRQTEMVKKLNKIFSAELIKKIINMLEKTKESSNVQEEKDTTTPTKKTSKSKSSLPTDDKTTSNSNSPATSLQSQTPSSYESNKKADHIHAANLYSLLGQTTFLPSNFKQSLQNSLKEKYPNLFTRIEYIYTTKEGLAKYQAELDELMNVEMPKNTKSIGDALALGDISENAELDAAREIQFQLVKKLSEMQGNLQRVQLIDFKNLQTDEVRIGCITTLEDEKGNQSQYTILGPWDVDPKDPAKKGVISFMTNIAKALLGCKVGDTVKLLTGTYKIVSITPYQTDDSEE